MIRKARIADYESILAITPALLSLYPHLIPNQKAIKHLFTECISGAQNFAWVSEVNGRIVGCLFAVTYDHLWAQKKSNTVLAWACRESGEGVSLLREYRRWLDGRPAIRRGGFQFDIDVDVRIYRVLEACGFVRKGGCFMNEKGV